MLAMTKEIRVRVIREAKMRTATGQTRAELKATRVDPRIPEHSQVARATNPAVTRDVRVKAAKDRIKMYLIPVPDAKADRDARKVPVSALPVVPADLLL
jgi:hypothetical protein